MIRTLLILGVVFLLSGCGDADAESIPHNRAAAGDDPTDHVLFTFNNTDRFTLAQLDYGVSIELNNQSDQVLATDFELKVDYYDDGWSEQEAIDFFTRTHDYSLERNHHIRQTVYTDHFNTELESGRYRLRVDYVLTDQETNEQEPYSIGAVFWVED